MSLDTIKIINSLKDLKGLSEYDKVEYDGLKGIWIIPDDIAFLANGKLTRMTLGNRGGYLTIKEIGEFHEKVTEKYKNKLLEVYSK